MITVLWDDDDCHSHESYFENTRMAYSFLSKTKDIIKWIILDENNNIIDGQIVRNYSL